MTMDATFANQTAVALAAAFGSYKSSKDGLRSTCDYMMGTIRPLTELRLL
jgi:hypothetical protein